MAEGGKWSRSFLDSFSKASGDADESFCDPCKGEGQYIAVEGYCPICIEYLCEHCLQVHRKQKLTKAHAILDKKQMPSGQGSTSDQELCVDVCKTHHPEIIRFYCKAHDEPGCGDCMTLKHTACKKDRVQDISGDFNKTKEFKDIDQQLQQLHQELENMDGELDNNLKNLDTTYNQVLEKITSVRKQVNQYLDKMQKKVKDEADQMKKKDEIDLKEMQTENQAMKAEIEGMLKTLHDSYANINSIFVISKQAKHRLVTIETEINKMKQSQQQYDFHIFNEIQNIISAKTPLGKLSRTSSQKVQEMTEKQDQKTRPGSEPTVDTKATYNRSINVECETDKENCIITDCTLLGKDRLVITDNQNVKLVDLSNNTVISTYSTSSSPWGVTTLGTNMIAVTLCDEGKIQVLKVTSTSTLQSEKFTLQRKIKVNMDCRGIAYKDGKFVVSNVYPGRVDILDIQGKILHTIQPKQGKDNILQSPLYITFGQDNDTVIISDCGTNTVSVVTFRGQILRIYTHKTLRQPCGTVMTADGVLYVCSWDGRCIHVVSPDFKTSNIIIHNDNYVVSPAGITYCDINHTLYISNTTVLGRNLDNQIQVYDLNVPAV